MSKADPADQVKFLVSCIGHTNNGRPDFTAVAEELGIVSKAAAQKRYERMLKANGVTASKANGKSANGYGSVTPTPQTTPVKRKAATRGAAAAAGGSPTKKAKAKAKGKKIKAEDSDEYESSDSADSRDVKDGVKKEEETKKEEDTGSDLSDPPTSVGEI